MVVCVCLSKCITVVWTEIALCASHVALPPTFFNLPMMIICRRATDVLSVTNFFPEAQMVN